MWKVFGIRSSSLLCSLLSGRLCEMSLYIVPLASENRGSCYRTQLQIDIWGKFLLLLFVSLVLFCKGPDGWASQQLLLLLLLGRWMVILLKDFLWYWLLAWLLLLLVAYAAAAKSLRSCPTLCDPIDGSPPGSPAPGILQARTLEWVAISFSNGWKWKVKVKSLSCVWLFATPWMAAYQAPPSMGFSRQEYWSGVSLPSPSVYEIELIKTKCLVQNWTSLLLVFF